MSDKPVRGALRGRGAARGAVRGAARGRGALSHAAPAAEVAPAPAAAEAAPAPVAAEAAPAEAPKAPVRGRGAMRGIGRGRRGGSDALVKPTLTLKEVCPVFLSIQDDDDEICTICRMEINGPCSDCKTIEHTMTTCPMAVGRCRHKYHLHCINKWLKSGNMSCPLCSNRWERSQ